MSDNQDFSNDGAGDNSPREQADPDDAGRFEDDQKRMRYKLRSNVTSPRVPTWDNAKALNYNVVIDQETGEAENIVDYENLVDVNNTINSLRVAMFKLTRGLDDTERKLKLAKVKYERAFRREYLTSSEKTETRKKEYASLMTEDIEDEVIYLDQMRSEFVRRATLMRDELSIMNTLSNNIRQQIKI